MLFWVRSSDLCMPWWTCIVVSLNYVCLSVLIALLLSIRVYTGSQRAGLCHMTCILLLIWCIQGANGAGSRALLRQVHQWTQQQTTYMGHIRDIWYIWDLPGRTMRFQAMNSAADHLYGTYMGHMTYMGPSGADNAVPSNELSSRPLIVLHHVQAYGTYMGHMTYMGHTYIHLSSRPLTVLHHVHAYWQHIRNTLATQWTQQQTTYSASSRTSLLHVTWGGYVAYEEEDTSQQQTTYSASSRTSLLATHSKHLSNTLALSSSAADLFWCLL